MEIILGILFFVTAVLYSAVGFGGGSGYLAVMGLLSLPPEIMRPTSLALNMLVAGIGTWKHVRAGHFSGRLFWPISIVSIPFAFIGGKLSLPVELYRPVVGLILIYAAVRLWLSARNNEQFERRTAVLPLWVAILTGAAIGFVSGLVGIGGGVFLGPVLLLTGWADTRQTMSITAAFVLVNSLAGLVGNISVVQSLPTQLPFWLLTAGVGGWLGADLSARRLASLRLRQLLSVVLVTAALLMIFG
jgi:uncharacterized membrane protein YfcA